MIYHTFYIMERLVMPAKKYHIELTDEERSALEQMLRRGKHSARKLTRARILLKADLGLRDEDIARELATSIPTIERLRKRFAEVRLEAIDERPRPGRKPLLNELSEARLIAEACSKAPDGRKHWTLQLLADRVVELKLSQSCSDDTVGRILKKTNSSPGSSSSGASQKSAGRL
jgi:transposase